MSEMSALKGQLLRTKILAQLPDLVNQNASDYVAGLIQKWYVITDDGEFQQTDETPLRTEDFRPMDIAEIGNYLRQTHNYLFRQSAPSGNSNATTAAPPPPNKAEMTLAQKCEFIRLNGEQAFLNLPDNPVAAKPLAERPRSTWTVEERARYIREFGQDAYLSLPAWFSRKIAIMPRWQKGQSGNPAGKAPGTTKIAKYRQMLEGKAPDLVETCIRTALCGDTIALRLCIERLVPAYKSVDPPVILPSADDGSIAVQSEIILNHLLSGGLPADLASRIMQTLAMKQAMVEIKDLAARISRLEETKTDDFD